MDWASYITKQLSNIPYICCVVLDLIQTVIHIASVLNSCSQYKAMLFVVNIGFNIRRKVDFN